MSAVNHAASAMMAMTRECFEEAEGVVVGVGVDAGHEAEGADEVTTCASRSTRRR